MAVLEVVACGPLASIQDHGRIGLARLGIPRSGAMDPLALGLANALVGNAPGEGAVEMAWLGLTLRARRGPVAVAVTGAPEFVRRDGRAEVDHTTIVLETGETLEIGRAVRGVFMYLAIGGGFDIAPVLASRSLYARAGVGGLNGRGLQPGDVLSTRGQPAATAGRLVAAAIEIDVAPVLRVLPGPEAGLFSPDAVAALLSSPFAVTDLCDRMAYRLAGPPLQRRVVGDLVSTGTVPGAVQVPPDGQPLVLMADCQTVGGYPRIATVVSSDLRRLAQCRPGTAVRFEVVDVAEAHRLLREERARQWRMRSAPATRSPSPQDAFERLAACRDFVTDGLDPGSWSRMFDV